MVQSSLETTPSVSSDALMRAAELCGDAAQTSSRATGIQQQFVHPWLLKQTSHSGDGRVFFFPLPPPFPCGGDLDLLKCTRSRLVVSDRPAENRRWDGSEPKTAAGHRERGALDLLLVSVGQINGQKSVAALLIAPTFTFQTLCLRSG